jgi:purine nucleosidase
VTRLVIDTDPGVDDAQAIMLAFAHPRARVETITVVAGNVGLDRTLANACTILDMLEAAPGAPPVFAGSGRSLVADRDPLGRPAQLGAGRGLVKAVRA